MRRLSDGKNMAIQLKFGIIRILLGRRQATEWCTQYRSHTATQLLMHAPNKCWSVGNGRVKGGISCEFQVCLSILEYQI